MSNIILGTAGHIDHGKTTLIKALTGINTDRLLEEKKRGITIDLGFAHMTLPSGRKIGIVDVPGHERFIKNMVAGAGGIDIILFIIAADEGVMPQTREHLNILNILNINRGIVVVTKKDMVEKDWLDLVVGEIREIIKGTFLENSPIVSVSSTTGDGIQQLLTVIDELCSQKTLKDLESPFRLPVDRAFTLSGIGTVVTGSLICGSVKVGDEVEVFPSRKKSRVRTVQVYGKSAEEAQAGQRTALNLVDLKVEDIRRGDVITEVGALSSVDEVYAYFRLLKDAPQTIKNRTRVRFHIGTKEVMARILLPLAKDILPGEEAFVRIIFEESIACAYKDKFIVRSYSPITTIGGGEVLYINPVRIRKRDEEKAIYALKRAKEGNLQDFIVGLLKFFGKPLLRISEVKPYMGKNFKQIEKIVKDLIPQEQILLFKIGEEQLIMDGDFYNNLTRKALLIVKNYHEKNPLKDGIGKEELRNRLNLESGIFESFLMRWIDKGLIEMSSDNIKTKGFSVIFSQKQEKILSIVLDLYNKGGWAPPTLTEVLTYFDKNQENQVREMLSRLMVEGRLIRLTEELLMSKEWVRKAMHCLQQHFEIHSELSVAEFRNILSTTRKYALPLLEYMDSQKYTKRVGNIRIPGKNLFGDEK